MERDDRVWLKHKETGGFFESPALVVAEYEKNGWQRTDDRPAEPNPALAERPAEWFEPIPGPEPVKPKSSKRASASTAEESDSVG